MLCLTSEIKKKQQQIVTGINTNLIQLFSFLIPLLIQLKASGEQTHSLHKPPSKIQTHKEYSILVNSLFDWVNRFNIT